MLCPFLNAYRDRRVTVALPKFDKNLFSVTIINFLALEKREKTWRRVKRCQVFSRFPKVSLANRDNARQSVEMRHKEFQSVPKIKDGRKTL